ncbi:hypothetical protein [Klebsiella pneumoniae]|uniref:hypothetical protein n=1 Tax=Klebsiella pneumoniae TaxID=573 RepID=UPI002153493D|nr:hypothetical protein [Klebsiella pneumoniae]
MTKSTITRERVVALIAEHSYDSALVDALEHLLAAMDSEPVAYIFKHPAGRLFWSLTDKSNKGHDDVMPVYASPQPAPVVEREPIAWLNDAYLARGVVDGEAGSEDAGPGYIPVYREAGPRPAQVVPDELKEAAADFLTVLDEYPEQLVPINRDSAVVRALRSTMLHGSNSPVIPDGYVMVPINMTTEQMRAVQRDSTLGTFASAHLKGAFDLYREFWSVAVAASPQEVRKSNVVDTYQGADGKEHEIIYLTSSQKEVK